MYPLLAEPPDLLIKNDTNNVNDPPEGCAEEKNDRSNNANHVVRVNTLYKSVYRPNKIKCGNTKNKLNDPRKIVKCLD